MEALKTFVASIRSIINTTRQLRTCKDEYSKRCIEAAAFEMIEREYITLKEVFSDKFESEG